MSRFASISFTAVSAAAAQDVFEITAAAGKSFIVHEIVLAQYSDSGDAQAEGLAVAIKRGTGSFSSGSGGSTPTPAKHATNDAAVDVTAKANNTTQCTAGAGALTFIRSDAWNVQGGYQYLPTPESRLLFLPTEACVVSITAPADAITLNGTVVIEEL